jgi:peptidoglycan/LPS O-acetylase OafA/YrhL
LTPALTARPARPRRLDRAAAGDPATNNFAVLRLVAALLVLFSHSFAVAGRPQPLAPVKGIDLGTVGVLIFFSMSGFLVARSWAGVPRLRDFAAKRALRLLPALFVSSLVTALILGPLVTTEPLHAYLDDHATKYYVLNNSLLQTDYALPGVFLHLPYAAIVNGSLWTLPIEAKAYVFAALAGALGLLTRRPWAMVPIAVLAVAATIDSVRTQIPGADHFVASLLDVQASPSLVYAAQQGKLDEWAALFAAFAVGAALFATRRLIPLRWDLAALVVAAWVGVAKLDDGSGRAPLTAAAVALPYLLLVVAYAAPGRLRLPPRIGDLSYGTYLYAFPVGQALEQVTKTRSGWAICALSLPPTLALAFASWRLVEAPALARKPRPTA